VILNKASGPRTVPPSFEASAATRHWLFDVALPYWLYHGIDREAGGFFEFLDLDGRPVVGPYKRTRVTARQIYVFSHAALLGVPGAAEAAEHGFRFLVDKHRGSRPGAWCRTVTRNGETLDAASDLYDSAFVMFALAWWGRLSGDPWAEKLAAETLDHIRSALRHPSGQGYLQDEHATSVFLQNPHMHLLEALVELLLVRPNERFAEEASALVNLFRSKLLADGTLREFYDGCWSPAPGEAGRLVEPGHMAEWSWLLRRCNAVTGTNNDPVVVELMNFVITTGLIRPDGLLVDAVFEDGTPMKSSTRLWPQTEMIKGLVAYSEVTGNDVSIPIERARSGLFARFLDPAPAGCWIDHFDACARPIVDKIPASSLYHLVLGLTEYLRFTDSRPSAAGSS
jgi:mannose/cellobiose epimerase-like protein (N-acyl-D-glucosamine 2-epimerase family)